MTEKKAFKYAALAILVCLFIPVLLNFLLPINTGLNVIAEDDPNMKLWLSFWGSYLAAIGSFTLAGLSYWLTKTNNEELKRNRNFEMFRVARERYNNLESYVVAMDSAFHPSRLKAIYVLIQEGECSLAFEEIGELRSSLVSSSNRCVGFLQNDRICDYGDDAGEQLFNYGKELKNLQEEYESILDKLEQFLLENRQAVLFCDTSIDEEMSRYLRMENIGTDLLLSERKKIRKFAKDNNIEIPTI